MNIFYSLFRNAKLASLACAMIMAESAHAKTDYSAQNASAFEKFNTEWNAVLATCIPGQAKYLHKFQITGFDGSSMSMDSIQTSEVSGWTGGCREGKRDGPGVLSVRSHSLDVTTGQRGYAHWYEVEGNFVEGMQVGLGCYVRSGTEGPDARPMPHFCTVFGGDGNPGGFRREPDGRWAVAGIGNKPVEPVAFAAKGALERESERVIAAAKQRRPIGRVRLPVVVADFGDIIRGGSIVLAPSKETPSLRGKRVAIVLSARAVTELERFTKMREALVNSSTRVPKEARRDREEFIAGSDPGYVVASVVAAVNASGATAVPAEDLNVLKSGAADYALVFDWRFTGNFALDAKQYAALPPCSNEADTRTCYQFFRHSFSGWLVNSSFEAERFYEWDLDKVSTHNSSADQKMGYGRFFGVLTYTKLLFNIDNGEIRNTVGDWFKY